MKVINLLQKDC